MKKINYLLLIILSLLVFGCKKEVQIGTTTFDVSKEYNICISQSSENEHLTEMRKGFVVGLKNLGLVEDVNVKFVYENAKGNSSYANQIADAFIEKNPDLILSIGEISTKAVYEKCKNIPIVFLGCANAKELGFCDSKYMPLGNMTGVRENHLIDERLDFISKNYSNIKKLGIIYDANNTIAKYDVDYHKFYATAYNIDIFTMSIKNIEDIEKAIDNMLPKVDAISLVTDDKIDQTVDKIVSKFNANNKLVFGRTKEHKNIGCIVENIPDYKLVGEKASYMCNDILVNNKNTNEIKIEYVDFK